MTDDGSSPVEPGSGTGQAGSVRLDQVSVTWLSPEGPGEPTTVLDRLDVVVEPASFVAIVGPSGCGKSTILRILAGLLVPDSGTATVGGVDVAGRPGACAWLSQRDNLLPWRRVLGNAIVGAELSGRNHKDAEPIARDLLERFGLGGLERSWPSQLSGGMRQRLAVLRTFLVDAPVLLLDEPFGALDALTRRQMQSWLQQVWLEDSAAGGAGARRTVLLVTHDVEEALLLADRVVVLSARPGRIVEDRPVPFARPRPSTLVSEMKFVEERAGLLTALGV